MVPRMRVQPQDEITDGLEKQRGAPRRWLFAGSSLPGARAFEREGRVIPRNSSALFPGHGLVAEFPARRDQPKTAKHETGLRLRQLSERATASSGKREVTLYTEISRFPNLSWESQLRVLSPAKQERWIRLRLSLLLRRPYCPTRKNRHLK